MRIGIANDVRVAAAVVQRIVAGSGRHSVAWIAADGEEAVAKCAADRPDIILMDLLMPGMDGVEATRRIMAETPCAILLVTASVEENSAMVFDALGDGALDVVSTPVTGGRALLEKIDEIERRLRPGEGAASADHLVCIGASSGGPRALAEVLGDLDPGFPAGIVVVQQLDADFARGLVDWLGQRIGLEVRRAEPGAAPAGGCVLVAPGDEHLVLTHDGRLMTTQEPYHRHCPSIDVFFESVAGRWKGSGTGVLLTGMGVDGAAGLLALKEAGFRTIVQDEATCAVFDLPRAAIEHGAAAEVLAAPDIAARF